MLRTEGCAYEFPGTGCVTAKTKEELNPEGSKIQIVIFHTLIHYGNHRQNMCAYTIHRASGSGVVTGKVEAYFQT